jgi:hypothetical protein
VTAAALAAASAAVAAGAAVQGSVGFGLALVAAPLVALVDPALVPGPMLVAGLVLPLLTAHRERDRLDVAAVKWALVGRVPGSLAGSVLLAGLSERAASLVVGVVVLAGVAMTASGVRVRTSAANLFGAGLVSGFMGTTSSAGGPPLALLYQHAEGPELRGTLSGYFACAAAISIAVLVGVGRFGTQELAGGLALLPATVVGFLFSGRVVRALDAGYTRVAVLLVAALGGVALLVREIF